MTDYRFEIFKDKNGHPRFRFVAPNNKIMLQSEAYDSKANALRAVAQLIEKVPLAEISDVTNYEPQNDEK